MISLKWTMVVALAAVGVSGCFGNPEGGVTEPGAAQPAPGTEEPAPGGMTPPATGPTEPPNNEPSPNPGPGGAPDDAPKPDDADPAKDRPPTKTGTIALEGNPETFSFTLHDDPALKLSTYIVEDFLVEQAASEDGRPLVIYANFAGIKNEEAKVVISASPGTEASMEDLIEETRQSLVKEGFAAERPAQGEPMRYSISDEELYFSKRAGGGPGLVGTVSFINRGDSVYRILIQYPAEMAEGFGARVHQLLEDIVWYE